MIRMLILLVVSLCGVARMDGQPSAGEYRVTLTIGAGYSRFLTPLGMNGLNRNGFAGTVRSMWVPEHLLSVGVEFGYQHLYTYGEEISSPEFGRQAVRSSLAAFPIHLLFAMRVTNRLDLLAGSGVALLSERTTAFQSENRAMQWSNEIFAGVAYQWNVNERLRLGSEVKYFGVHKTEGGNIVLQVTLTLDLLRY